MAELPHHHEFQDVIAAHLWRTPGALMRWHAHVKGAYFEDAATGQVVGLLAHYFERFKQAPLDPALRELVRKAYPDPNDQAHVSGRTRAEKKIDKLAAMDLADAAYTEEQVGAFVGDRSVRAFVMETIADIEGGNPVEGLVERAKEAAQAGAPRMDIGHDWVAESYGRVMDYVNPDLCKRVSTGLYHLDLEMGGGPTGGEINVLLAPPKGFKCSGEHTPIMMHDGSVKEVQDIVVGDLVMGDDSAPRRVLEVGRGRGEMYDVTQPNGDDYTVTADHVLCLKRPPGSAPSTGYGKRRYHSGGVLEMTAEEYARQTPWFRRTWQGYKVGVDFPAAPVPIDPYYIGLWLGDGHARNTTVSVGDEDHEVRTYLHHLASEWGLGVNEYRATRDKRGERVKVKAITVGITAPVGAIANPLLDALRSVGLVKPNPKHLPDLYRINSREVRLQVLAGMIDSDGHFSRVKGFIFSNSNRRLCEDAQWLARSLGLRAHIIEIKSFYRQEDGTKVWFPAWRTLIQGRISEIPTKLPRKRGRDSVRVSERTPIKVKPAGVGDWYGFRLDGNNRYLMSDFTVTHNSGSLLNLALAAMRSVDTCHVAYFTLELKETLVGLRADHRTTMMTRAQLFADPRRFYDVLGARQDALYGNSRLFIKYLPPKKCSPSMILQYARQLEEQEGIKLGLVIVDYLNLMTNDGRSPDKEYSELVAATTELRGVMTELDVPCWTACRATREATSKRTMSIADIAGAFEISAIADWMGAICITPEERARDPMQARLVPIATRNDSGNRTVVCEIDATRMSIVSVETKDTDEIDEEEAEKIQEARRKRSGKKREPDDAYGGFDFANA